MFEKINKIIAIVFLKLLGGFAITAEFYPRLMQRFFWSDREIDCEVDYWIVLLGFLMITGQNHYDKMVRSIISFFNMRFGNSKTSS